MMFFLSSLAVDSLISIAGCITIGPGGIFSFCISISAIPIGSCFGSIVSIGELVFVMPPWEISVKSWEVLQLLV